MRGLYPIVDVTTLAARGIDPVAFAQALLEARPAALQLRAKELPRATRSAFCAGSPRSATTWACS